MANYQKDTVNLFLTAVLLRKTNLSSEIIQIAIMTFPKMAKAMSESHLAMLVYHGWTLSSILVDEASDSVAEYFLIWEKQERPPVLDVEEIRRFSKLSVIEDVFEITGRGIVIVPGIPRVSTAKIHVKEPIVLLDKRSTAILTQVSGIELCSPSNPLCMPILLENGLTKRNVSIGMEVWIRNSDTQD